jgi:hypothetical protein
MNSALCFGALLTLTAFAGNEEAIAGDIVQEIVTAGSATASQDTHLNFSSDQTVLKLADAANSRTHFDFVSPDAVEAMLHVTITAAPNAGSDAYDVAIPFFLATKTITVYGSLVSESVSDSQAQKLSDLLAGQARTDWLSDPKKTFTYISRARRFFAARIANNGPGSGNPQTVDVNLAYWQVEAANNLLLAKFMVPSQLDLAAADWLMELSSQPDKRLFADVKASDASDAAKALNQWQSVLLQNEVSKLEPQLRSTVSAVHGDACMRVTSLWQRLHNMAPDEQKSVAYPKSVFLRATVYTAECLIQATAAANRISVDTGSVSKASDLLSDLSDLLEANPDSTSTKNTQNDLQRLTPGA